MVSMIEVLSLKPSSIMIEGLSSRAPVADHFLNFFTAAAGRL